jgi:hypothetical protein
VAAKPKQIDQTPVMLRLDWEPARAAVIICDMWDTSCCIAAAKRVVEMAPHMNADEDAVTDSGQEVFNLLEQRGIDDVLVMGVHTNICVLGRPYGIRQLVYLGKKPILCRDLTDSFHRDERGHAWGTDAIVAHIERYWCPTVTSDRLLGGAPFQFKPRD